MEDEFSLEAKIYDRIWGRSDYDADVKFLDELFRGHNCKSIIDIGCGTGNHALRLGKLGYEVTGIDISPAMLQKAKEKNENANVKFIQGDMKKLEKSILKGERFDGAICLGIVFYHLLTNKAMEVFLNGVHKLPKKTGYSFLTREMRRKSTKTT